MKITTISISIEPNEREKLEGREIRIISRIENKLWCASQESGQIGLFPFEIKLVHDIQEIISKFNGDQK